MLILVELVVIGPLMHMGPYRFLFLQVIWVIGWSMIVLAGLIFLPTEAIVVLALVIVCGHNAFDRFAESPWGGSTFVWQLLHVRGFTPTPGIPTLTVYPLIPWPAVMAFGYAFGAVLQREPSQRDRWCFIAGILCIVLFVAVRTWNVYGDPAPWSLQPRGLLFTAMSFLNVTKYPPSFLFLLATLGPVLLAMPCLERWQSRLSPIFSPFGRVPFFYYILHWIVIRIASWAWIRWRFDSSSNSVFVSPSDWPAEYGPSIVRTYVVWVVVVVMLYPCCRWYADLKSRKREWRLLSYL